MALSRLPKVGEFVFTPLGIKREVIEILDNGHSAIVVINHWLKQHKEWDRFIGRFADGSFNNRMTLEVDYSE